MLLVDTVYIHESGAKSLLVYFLEQLTSNRKDFYILFDDRFTSPIIHQFSSKQYQFIAATEKNRKKIYKALDSQVTAIFCFANVPPPVSVIDKPVFIYFHNLLLLSKWNDKDNYKFSNKILLFSKRAYIHWKNRSNYHWFVQSNRMKFLLGNRLNIASERIQVIPFFPVCELSEQSVRNDIQFIYVADGVPQKNHVTLLKAWEYLYDHHGLSPVLHLTLDARYDSLVQQIKSLQKKGISIVNHGVISKDELNQLYSKCSYLVFPSLAESFGLPLIEAVQHGCGVLASELPFVTDVIVPSAQFDPYKYKGISDLVASMINKDCKCLATLKISNEINCLINEILDSANISN